MKILLHICCAPCAIYPLRILRESEREVVGLYYNPNIHPYLEYRKRLDTVKGYASAVKLDMMIDEYPMEAFLRRVVFHEDDRCRYCYTIRLARTAETAKRDRFDAFTTTLLYSKFQRHDLIREIGEGLAEAYGVRFLYRDFREGWAEGVQASKELGLYRQPYCGCLYSEKERYMKLQK